MADTAVSTETPKTVKTVTVASLSCILKDRQKEGKVLSRTVRTAKTVIRLTPLNSTPFVRHLMFLLALSEYHWTENDYIIHSETIEWIEIIMLHSQK